MSDEGAAPDQSPAAPPKRKSRTRRLLIALLVLSAALALGWWFGFEPLVRHLTVTEARKRGLQLTLGSVHAGWSQARLRDASFELVGAAGVQGSVEQLEVTLSGLEPRALLVDGAELTFTGSAPSLVVAVSAWIARYAHLLSIPAEGRGLDVSWRLDAKAPPSLLIEGATVVPHALGASLRAKSAKLFGFELGQVGAIWRGDSLRVMLGIGAASLEASPLRIEVLSTPAQPAATISLRETTLEQLMFLLGLPLKLAGSAAGFVELYFSKELLTGPISGMAVVRLRKLPLPIPPEAKAFVRSDSTDVSAVIDVAPDRRIINMHDLRVQHGAITLYGGARLTRVAEHALVRMRLEGSLRCVDIAPFVLGSKMGGALGRMVGSMARGMVQGNVTVVITIEADSRKLAAAKIGHEIGVGCGLRLPTFELPQLPKLPILPDVQGEPDEQGEPGAPAE